MRTAVLRLALFLSALLPMPALAESAAVEAPAPAVSQPTPVFPVSERNRDRQGWVLVDLEIDELGLVSGSNIRNSSGSDAFDEAALKALDEWRYAPSEQTSRTVLVSFVYSKSNPTLRRNFTSRYKKIHKAVDAGDLDKARRTLRKIRQDKNLSAFELAYSFIAEGRIAAASGDRREQLRCFRLAMLNDGHWVASDTYQDLLYAAVVLEIQEEDYGSALRDFSLLSESAPGRDATKDLENVIQEIRSFVENSESEALPFTFADQEIMVETRRPDWAREQADSRPRQGDNSIEEREFQRQQGIRQ